MTGKVILIAGPAGVGKTTTAQRIARNAGWVLISEDDAWVTIKAGHPAEEPRTPEEEAIVQAQTLAQIEREVAAGNNVVLEFILYRNPPLPVIFYREELLARGIEVITRLLRASDDEIWARKQRRGWEWDRDETAQRAHARHQLSCLDSDYFEDGWIIDSTALSAEEFYQRHFAALVASA